MSLPSPETIFAATSALAMAGWLMLASAPLAPRLSQVAAGLAIPALLGIVYAAVMAMRFAGAEGGFGSLADVAALFADPWLLLAGWVHYLAFDMLIGAWIARTAAREGVAHVLVLPCLFLTFMAGPVGWLLFRALRPLTRNRNPMVPA